MIDLHHEQDIERLRQVALLLQAENDRLMKRLVTLKAELAKARGQKAVSLQQEIQFLQEQLDARTKELFGPSSEKRPPPPEQSPPKPKKKHPGHGPTPQLSLPIVEVVHTVDEADRFCTLCGKAMVPFTGQFEAFEEIDVVERSYVIRRHKREKLVCSCGGCVETAFGPVRLIPGGRYSVDFAVSTAVAKYADHLPLSRQCQMMARQKLTVGSQTLWDQIHALSRYLLPTYRALRDYALTSLVIGADETTWQYMQKGKTATYWVWSVVRPDAVYYCILSTRSADAAKELLGDYQGIVMADGYSAYPALLKEQAASRDGPVFILVHCWAHARRKLLECEGHYPQVAEVLKLIGELYKTDAKAKEIPEGERLAALGRLRAEESAKTLRAIREWLLAQKALERSALGKAITYIADRWEGLTRFVSDPRIPLDNNASEQAMRRIAVGRKNHYGSHSIAGTEVAALFYSLIESAKLSGIQPAAYLAEATRRAIAIPGTVTLPKELLPKT